MHINKHIFLSQTGETIVEVLFSIAVLASALGGAFAISTRSKNTMQANQERYQAQLIANGQADNLKLYMAKNSTFGGFCFDSNGNKQTSSDSCKFNNGNNPDLYNVSINQPNPAVNFFVIKVIWDSLVNGEQDQVELVYGT
jgi:type II secretory pathway pseudopilin PulG